MFETLSVCLNLTQCDSLRYTFIGEKDKMSKHIVHRLYSSIIFLNLKYYNNSLRQKQRIYHSVADICCYAEHQLTLMLEPTRLHAIAPIFIKDIE